MRASFYVLVIGFMSGVAFRSLVGVSEWSQFAIFVCATGVLTVGILLKKQSLSMYVSFFLLAVVLGIFRTDVAFSQFENGKVLTGDAMHIGEGVVVSEPDVRDTYTVLYVELKNESGKNETKVRVKVPLYPEYVYGERVLLRGEVHVPETFETETGRTFDYPGYLMKDNVQYELRDVSVRSTGVIAGNTLTRTLLSLKRRWLTAIAQTLREPDASLAGGVIVGAKQSLGEHWLQAFRDTGIIHIVVLSGYNLTLVANSIVRSTVVLPTAARFALGSFGVFSFALMVGGGATVVRASIMAILGMFAVYVKRPYLLVRALFLAALAMVLWNPFVLVFDAGFQLSFVATLGLIALAPSVEGKCTWIPARWGLRNIAAATIATQLAVLPLLLYHIGTVSLIAPVVNMLVLPVVPVVMLVGFITGSIGMYNIVLALPFSFIAHVFFVYIFSVVDLFSSIPYATVTLTALPWWSLIFLYSMFPLWYFAYKPKRR